MIELPGPGYVWFDYLMTVPTEEHGLQLVAKYGRVNAYFGNYERGIAIYNDEDEIFEKHQQVDAWLSHPVTMEHPILVSNKGKEFYYLNAEFNFCRIAPDLDSVSSPDAFEYFTCILDQPGEESVRINRTSDGEIKYSWRRRSAAFSPQKQAQLLEQGLLKNREKLFNPTDVISGRPVEISRGSINWNPYRQRWILINGKQDIWYSEADSPIGPWVYFTKVATHHHYYYNPVHHPFLDEDEGRRIFFEGTFTKFFSTEPSVPRYEYNQLLYGIDLEDPRVALPTPVYVSFAEEGMRYFQGKDILKMNNQEIEIPFYALDRIGDSKYISAVYDDPEGGILLTLDSSQNRAPAFFAVKSDFNRNVFFEGVWKLKINWRSFQNVEKIRLSEQDGEWSIQNENHTFVFSDLSISDDSLEVDLEYGEDQYHLSGRLGAGLISGSFIRRDDPKSIGSWSATDLSDKNWTVFSPDLVDLNELQYRDGSVVYTTDSSFLASDSIIGTKVICKVWRNPLSFTGYDFWAQTSSFK